MNGRRALLSVAMLGLACEPGIGPAAATLSYSNAVLNDRPLLYWRLSESNLEVTARDASGNGRAGAYRSGVRRGEPGALNSDNNTAVTLDGSSGYVEAASALGGLNALSVELWAKRTTGGPNFPRLFLSTRVNRSITLTESGGPGDGGLLFRLTSRGVSTTVTSAGHLLDGQWHHIVATWDGAQMRLFVDGESTGAPVAFAGPLDPEVAGIPPVAGGESAAHEGGSSSFFNGSLDEVAVYDTALSATQVRTHHELGLGR